MHMYSEFLLKYLEFVSEFGESSVSNLESHLIERLKTVFLEEEFVGIITNS